MTDTGAGLDAAREALAAFEAVCRKMAASTHEADADLNDSGYVAKGLLLIVDAERAALSAARAEGAREAFERAAKVCDERAGRWRLRAERYARSGDMASLVHHDRMDEAESCAIDIRDRALAKEPRP